MRRHIFKISVYLPVKFSGIHNYFFYFFRQEVSDNAECHFKVLINEERRLLFFYLLLDVFPFEHKDIKIVLQHFSGFTARCGPEDQPEIIGS